MKSVMIIHPRPTRGGFTSVALQAHELIRRGDVRVHVVSETGDRLEELPDGVKIHVIPSSLRTIEGIRFTRSLIRAEKPDVLHLHGRQAGFIIRLFVPRHHGTTVLYTPHGTPWTGSSFLRWLLVEVSERILLSRTDLVLCVSYSELNDWTRRGNGEQLRYFPNPTPLVRPLGSQNAADIGSPPDSPDHRIVVVPSGYSPQKRLEVVVAALALTRDVRLRVHFYGTREREDYVQDLEKLASKLAVRNQVTFFGSVADIGDRMSDASLVVLPSFSEGMPIVAQEAILARCHVSWSRINPHIELFGSAGAPFWTARELAEILDGDHSVADVSSRLEWFALFARDVQQRRIELWNELFSRDLMRSSEGTVV